MNTTSSNKTWIWIVLIIIVAGFAYFYFYSNSTPSSTLDATNGEAAVGTQILGLLNQIKTLRIDSTIFTDPGYKTLRDYSVVIPPVAVGRPNPFAPLPGMPVVSGKTTN